MVKKIEQKKGVDFNKIFSPIVKISSIQTILRKANSLDLKVKQLDMKTIFLHGDLEEDTQMEQPERFEVAGKKHTMFKVNKSLMS